MIGSHRKFAGLLATASIVALASPLSVVAQEDGDAAETETRRLNTVEITTTRREGATVQDVPIAITVIDPQMLERAGVADIKNLDSVAPSFSMSTSNSESGGIVLRLRGVGTTGNNVGLESAVGVFLDGIYLSRPGIALADLLDVEQIEVARGPQGTLFGRNTSAGALVIQTKKPDFDGFSGFANATFGNYNLQNYQLGLNIPVSDNVAFRLSGAIRQRDGFLTNADGDDVNDRDRMTLRGQALVDFGDMGSVRLIADYAEGDDKCCDAVWFRESGRAAAFAAAPLGNGVTSVGASALDNYTSNGTSNFANPFDQTGFSLTYENDLGFGDLTYIASYRDYTAVGTRDDDFTSNAVFTTGASPDARATGNFDPNGGTNIETTTHELRLQGVNGPLDWLVGAYYSDEQINSRGSLTLLADFQQATSTGILGSPANVFNLASNGVSANGDFAISRFKQSGESFSVFTHNVYNFTDQFNVTVGLRYVDESKDGSYEQLGGQHNACLSTFANLGGIAANPNLGVALVGPSVGINCFVFAAPAYDPNNPTPLFAAIGASPFAGTLALLPQEFDDTFEDDELVYTIKGGFKLNEAVNFYAGFTHGFKSGGFNLDASAAAGGADPRFSSEKVDAYEVGMKATLWDGRANVNIAAFHQEMDDFQVLEFTGTRFQTFTVDEAISSGFELESQAQLTDNFTGSFAVTYADARYPDDCATQVATDPDFLANAANLCGESLTNSPEWTSIVGGTWEQPINDGRQNVFIAGSARYESDRRTSTQATEVTSNLLLPGDIQEAHTKFNLRIGLESEDDRWAIELWGNNITDERTKNVTFSIPLRGGAGDRARGQFVQDPSTYGVTLRTKF